MNTSIKTCTQCGAKNFLEFKTCFNCGGTDFVINKSAQDTTAQAEKKSVVERKTIFDADQTVSGEVRKANIASQPYQTQAVALQVDHKAPVAAVLTRQKSESVPMIGQVREQTLQSKTANPLSAQQNEAGISAIQQMSRVEMHRQAKQSPVSKLGIVAQQERIRREAEERAKQTQLMQHMAQKLDVLEEKISANQLNGVSADSDVLRQTVGENITRLDQAIVDLKSGNSDFMESIIEAQRQQIASLEMQQNDFQQRLQGESETRIKNTQLLNYLNDEKQRLETELEQERVRFGQLMQDKDALKTLVQNTQLQLPNSYMVYSGNELNAESMEYAKRQFLKIYPEIRQDNENEDIIYYIPGEINNPPILVFNPDIKKDYQRNIKINIIDTIEDGSQDVSKQLPSAPFKIEAAQQFKVEDTKPTLGPSETVHAQPKLVPVVNGLLHNENSQPVSIANAEQENSQTSAKNPMTNEEAAIDPLKEQACEPEVQSAAKIFEKLTSVSQEKAAVQPQVITSEVVQTNAISDINELEVQVLKNRKKARVFNIALGVVAVLSLGLLALGFIAGIGGEVYGFQVIASSFGNLFVNSTTNYNLLVMFSKYTTAPWAAMADFVSYLTLASLVFTITGAVLCFVKPHVNGKRAVWRIVFCCLALALDIIIFASLFLTFSVTIDYVGLGVVLKLVADVVIVVGLILFSKKRKEKVAEGTMFQEA